MKRAVAASLLFALAACQPTSTKPPVTETPKPVDYTPAGGIAGATKLEFSLEPDGFFARPWPSELSRTADGKLDLASFPGKDAPIFGEYVRTASEDLDGFSIAPCVYFHATGQVDAASVTPTTEVTLTKASPILLLAVDGPDKGALVPLEVKLTTEDQRFVPRGTLAVKPIAGFVLRPSTTYAAVVRRVAGLGTTDDLEAIKWTKPRSDPKEERARLLHKPAFDALAAMGVPREEVASIAVFRTHAPHVVLEKMIDVVEKLPKAEAPRVLHAAWHDADDLARGAVGGYFVIHGTYCTPNFQSKVENAPYLNAEGGRVRFDAQKRPLVTPLPADSKYRSDECGGMIRARFVASIPRTVDMPKNGFPLLVTAHGTSGDARTFLGNHDFAGWAANQGIAVISTDQPLHGGEAGGRPGSREPLHIGIAGLNLPIGNLAEVAFYNPFYPGAARDNLRQAQIDLAVLVRLFGGLDLSPMLGDRGDRPRAVRFDASRVAVAGHSQGSQSVAAIGAVDPRVHGVLLSGCGGDARLGILLREDLDIMPFLRLLLGLDADELDAFHPMLALLQNLVDPIDPQSFARYYWEPLDGHKRQPVLHFSGIRDTFVAPATAEALALALRATPLEPVLRPVAGLRFVGLKPSSVTSERTFIQYASTRGENGHFVIYHEPGAGERIETFLAHAMER